MLCYIWTHLRDQLGGMILFPPRLPIVSPPGSAYNPSVALFWISYIFEGEVGLLNCISDLRSFCNKDPSKLHIKMS